jgi:bifunctional non-homologous end joining protein LigD
LALITTDHALSYRTFEGILPEGSYGAGPVIIWDEGKYLPEIEITKGVRQVISERTQGEQVMQEGLKKGEIKFFLYGKRLQGSFALVKTKNFGPKNSWLLIKHADTYTKEKYEANTYETSVVSHKTLHQLLKESSEG